MTINVQHGPIWKHRECTGTHRNAQELTGAHGIARERRILYYKVHRKHPINSQTSFHIPYDVVDADVLFFMMLMRRFLNKNSTPKFLTQN